jgi:hypothetical protein
VAVALCPAISRRAAASSPSFIVQYKNTIKFVVQMKTTLENRTFRIVGIELSPSLVVPTGEEITTI